MNLQKPVQYLDYFHFTEMLTKRFADKYSKKIFTSLLFIELHDLSRFNDTFGFAIDEQIMINFSDNIGLLLNSNDVLSRRGDNHIIIMQHLSSNEDAELLAKRIMHMISEPCVIKEHMFYINASVGISFYPLDENDAFKLIRSAKDAMEYGKKDRKDHISFSKDIIVTKPCEKTIRMMSDLPAAIENGEIYFLYQLQYSHKKERFSGAELLSRWDHPEYGVITPDVFIPMSEEIGMIGPLMIKSFDAAFKAFNLFKMNGIDDFSLSINISPTFLIASNFDETIDFLMEQYDLNGAQINFEITEEILLKHTEALINTLEKIKSHNIGIELDDFGTGYTSLRHLAYLPIDTLKVDQSFVRDIDKDIKKKALFNAIVDMANTLNINIIAEGVENNLEDSTIKKFGSIIVQGYFYSKPIELDQLIEKLKLS